MPTSSEHLTPGATARRAVRGALAERLPLKAISLFFALVLWFAVNAEEPGEQTIPVRLALRVDGSATMRGERPMVRATITGRRRDLIKVGAGPLVLRRTIAPGAADSVRLVVRPSDVELPAGIEGEVRVREVRPRVLTLRFAPAPPAATRAGPRPGAAAVTAEPTPRTPPAASRADDTPADDSGAGDPSGAVPADSGGTDTLFLSTPAAPHVGSRTAPPRAPAGTP